MSASTRKKSIVSSAGLQIDTPLAHNNTLLNKSASQSTSLYQQCSSLRSRLLRIRGFAPFFALASTSDSRQSTDPVTQLWDLFSLGIPLCFIFNLLESVNKITAIDTNPDEFDASDDRAKKRAIALFAMQIRQVSECEPIIVTDLWDRNSTDGLVKVRITLFRYYPSFIVGKAINTVTTIVDRLPESSFEATPPSPVSLALSQSSDSLTLDGTSTSTLVNINPKENARNNIVRELVETERKYVQDLETMQVGCFVFPEIYSALSSAEILERPIPKQQHESRYHTLSLSKPQQASQLST
jgi:cell division control protein 24